MTHPWTCGAERSRERGQGRPPVGLWTTPLLALILIFIIPRGELGLTNDNTQGGDKEEYQASKSFT